MPDLIAPAHASRTRSTNRSRTGGGVVAAALVAAVVGLAINAPNGADAATSTSSVSLAPTADTYVTSGATHSARGTQVRIQASAQPGHNKFALLRFVVPNLSGAVVNAQLVLTRDTHHLDSVVYANAVHGSWSERVTDFANAPAVGAVLDSKATNSGTKTVTLNVTGAVHSNAAVNLAITSRSTTGFASFRSREWGVGGPQLVLSVSAPTSAPTSAPASAISSAAASQSSSAANSAGSSSAVGTAISITAPPTGSAPALSCINNAKGIPSAGALVGATAGGTQSVPALEAQTNMPLAIHRSYYNADQVDKALSVVNADEAAGRLPWISFKMPYSWADMAAGRGNAWAINLVQRLAQVNGPIWLAFHHEPEGDGNMADWTAMQRHLAPLVHQYSNNIAYTTILIAWDSFNGPSAYRINNVWPGDGLVDIAAWDVYNNFGTTRGNPTAMLDTSSYFSQMQAFAQAHHVGWAIAETGYTNAAAAADPQWLTREYNDLVAHGGLALDYFDSSLNSIADWTLDTSNKIDDFTSLLVRSPRICQ